MKVFTGEVPFDGNSLAAAISAITQRRRPPRPAHPKFTKDLWILMQCCWDHKPHLRPKVSEVLQVLRAPLVCSGGHSFVVLTAFFVQWSSTLGTVD